MRKFIFVLCLLVATSVHAQKESTSLTLMSYNIKNGSGIDGKSDIARTAIAINHVSPDVVAIQEVDSVTQRNSAYVLKELGELTNMNYYYGGSIPYRGGKYGIGILSKEKPISIKHIPLPGREEARSMLLLEFDKYVYICTHLSLTEADRESSVSIIEKEVARFDRKAVFLAGDLNAKPEAQTITWFKKNFTILSDTKLFTFPADYPSMCIDYIMSYNNRLSIMPNFTYVYNEPLASDHRPLIVGVRIRPE